MKNHSPKYLLALALGATLMAPLAMAQGTAPVNGTNDALPPTVTPKLPVAATPLIVQDQTPAAAAAVPNTSTPTATPSDTTTATKKPESAKATASTGQNSWNTLDTDKDGNLSKAEAAADPGMKAIFAKADANADGILTADEYRAYYAKYQASVTRK